MQFEDAMVQMAITAAVVCFTWIGGTFIGDQLRFWYLARQERQPLPKRTLFNRIMGVRTVEFQPTQHLRSGYELGLYAPVTGEET